MSAGALRSRVCPRSYGYWHSRGLSPRFPWFGRHLRRRAALSRLHRGQFQNAWIIRHAQRIVRRTCRAGPFPLRMASLPFAPLCETNNERERSAVSLLARPRFGQVGIEQASIVGVHRMQGARRIVGEDAVLHDQIGHRGFGMLDEQRVVADAQPHDDVEVGPALREQARPMMRASRLPAAESARGCSPVPQITAPERFRAQGRAR